jgi:acetylornithine/N-succinyldiaminopimelate aminotransferase
MIGLRCVVTNTELVAKLREEGLLTVGAAENVVRLLPPLIIEEQQVDEAIQALERACSAVAKAA